MSANIVPALRLAIFMDGCFFHMCPQHGRIPDSNRTYWKPKLEGNVRRDRRSRRKLRADGWSVWRIWEHSLKRACVEDTARSLERRLSRRVTRVREAQG